MIFKIIATFSCTKLLGAHRSYNRARNRQRQEEKQEKAKQVLLNTNIRLNFRRSMSLVLNTVKTLVVWDKVYMAPSNSTELRV